MTERFVCCACRTVLGTPSCIDPSHPVVSLAHVEQRQHLIDTVWASARAQAPQELRRAQRRQVHLTVAGALVGGAGLGLAVFGPASGILTMLGGILGGATGQALARTLARRHPPELPRGAVEPALPAPSARGRIRRADEMESPASRTPCALWSIELRYEGLWGDRIMLRAAESAGLDITLDGGAAARIPPGPLRVVGAHHQLDDAEAEDLAHYLRGVDPRRGDDPAPPIPYNVVLELTLMVGDRIELVGPLEPSVVTTATARLYRDAPSTVLVPSGVPVIRLI